MTISITQDINGKYMNHQINLLVTLQAKQGKASELRELLKTLSIHSNKDAGCIEFRVGEAEEKSIFYIKECWENKALLDAHAKAKHVVDMGPLIEGCCESVDALHMTWED